jgi:hypothetical protein
MLVILAMCDFQAVSTRAEGLRLPHLLNTVTW